MELKFTQYILKYYHKHVIALSGININSLNSLIFELCTLKKYITLNIVSLYILLNLEEINSNNFDQV